MQQEIMLRAGADTAEGLYLGSESHPQATVGVEWPYEQGGVDYITVRALESSAQITELAVTGLPQAGEFVLRGISLIHQPTTTSRSVLLSTEGDYAQVHSGDVKVYENRAALPRALVVHQAVVVPDEDAAVAATQADDFDPRETLVRVADSGEPAGVQNLGKDSAYDAAEIVDYAPERVEISVALESPGWLVLADTFYPGWQASINGQPAEILPVNLLFRAVEVPAGEHAIIFEFKPESARLGMLISGATVLLVGLVLAGLVLKNRRGGAGRSRAPQKTV
jgi:hypothetical protein